MKLSWKPDNIAFIISKDRAQRLTGVAVLDRPIDIN